MKKTEKRKPTRPAALPPETDRRAHLRRALELFTFTAGAEKAEVA